MAVVLSFPELFDDFPYELNDTLVLSEPIQTAPDILELIRSVEDDVMPGNIEFIAPLRDVVKKIKDHQAVHISKGDKAMEMNDMENWFGGENLSFGILFIGSILGILTTVIVTFLVYKVFSLRQTMHRFNGLVPGLLNLVPLVDKAEAHGKEEIQWDMNQDMWYLIVLNAGAILLLYALYKLVKYIIQYYHTKWLFDPKKVIECYPSFLFEDKTDIYMEITNFGQNNTVCLYLGTVVEYPSDMYVKNQVAIGQTKVTRMYVHDMLEMDWKSCKIHMNHIKMHDFTLPYLIKVPFCTKFTLRKIFLEKDPIFRILSIHGKMFTPMTTFRAMILNQDTLEQEREDLGEDNHVYDDVHPDTESVRDLSIKPTAPPSPPIRFKKVYPEVPAPETLDTRC
jgi:hypothetical protein